MNPSFSICKYRENLNESVVCLMSSTLGYILMVNDYYNKFC